MKQIDKKNFKDLKENCRYMDVDSLKNGNFFFYLGPIYMNLPVGVEKNADGERYVSFACERIKEDEEYILRLLKISDNEAVLVGSGIHFRLDECNEVIDYSNPNDMIKKWNRPCLAIPKTNFATQNDASVSYAYEKYDFGDISEIVDYESYAEMKCIENLEKAFQEIYPSQFEQQFYKLHEDEISFYSKLPEVGEYFGYVGNIFQMIPKNIQPSNIIEFEKRETENGYPLLFKRISEDEAVEVTTNIKVRINADSKIPVANEKRQSALVLDIETLVCIEPTEKYKTIYGLATTDFEEFKNWLHKKEMNARGMYNTELRRCENTQIKGIFDLARVENAIYNLEKKLKLDKKGNNI